MKKQKPMENNNLKKKNLCTEDLSQKDLGEKLLIEKKITNNIDNKEKTDRELSTKIISEMNLNSRELTGNDENNNNNNNNRKRTIEKQMQASNEDENNLKKTVHVYLKEASVQTNIESKNCCDNLREEIFNMLENFKEQSRVRQAINSLPSREFPLISQNLGANTNLDSSTFENQPLMVNTSKVVTPKKNNNYKNFSPTSSTSPGDFVQKLEEKKDCLCCGTEVTFSNENSDNSKDSQKLRKPFIENEKTDDSQNVDATRPEFVNILLEIGHYTRNLERQLSQMNETMTNRVNEMNARSSRKENTRPMGSSTPKEAKNDEQLFLSLPNYMGSDIPNFSLSNEESSNEELVTNVKEFHQGNQLLISPPIGSSTPVLQNKKHSSEKNDPNNGKISHIRLIATKKVNEIPHHSEIQSLNRENNNDNNNNNNNKDASTSSDIYRSSFNKKYNKNTKIQNDDNTLEETQYKDFPKLSRKK
ncbi:ras guanine nucleotide exchange factor P-like [Leptopilina boulardi]|uniref:ras guanine nucleotide exchange factor P-like n=1 Tax=Leptopilina boulardi TaxID=63433 RepID=UPI0021F61812|nr:ras guanine nucleotide exchange factor P-like [Leptopilina boulardi]